MCSHICRPKWRINLRPARSDTQTMTNCSVTMPPRRLIDCNMNLVGPFGSLSALMYVLLPTFEWQHGSPSRPSLPSQGRPSVSSRGEERHSIINSDPRISTGAVASGPSFSPDPRNSSATLAATRAQSFVHEPHLPNAYGVHSDPHFNESPQSRNWYEDAPEWGSYVMMDE